MLKPARLKSWLIVLAALCAAAAAIPAAAGAQAFGELSRFGSEGVGNGQFKEAGAETVAFGVDPTTNNVFVGDKPAAHTARIQELSETGTFLGAATLVVKGEETGIEGVAVDPALHRFYVLVVQTRNSSLANDPEVTAAAALYAFSTEPTEKEGKKVLEPASGTEPTTGLLAGSTVLHPQSGTLGQSLLEPSGLTVDPTNGDIILMGREDVGNEELRTALERVSSAGALVGQRWVDSANSAFFEEESPSSPVVTSAGKVYVIGGALTGGGELGVEQIDEIPSSFAPGSAPKPFITYDSGANELVTFPGLPEPLEGGGLSLAPDGTLWVYSKILTVGETENFRNPGALSFTAAGAVRGWTGGQSLNLGTGKCTVSFFGHPMVAAGKNEQLFMFDSNPEAPRVVRFGPGGEGCPAAKAGPLAVSVGATQIEPGHAVEPGAEVKLSSALTQANAVTVKWSFGDGSEAVTTNQHQSPETTHKFTGEGEFKVKETIETDDLATPTIVVERTLSVSKPLPEASFRGLGALKVGELDSFDAKASTGSEGAAVTGYTWEFGDGSAPVTTTASSASHAYAAAGLYRVVLRVTDAHKRTSLPASVLVSVTAPSSPPTTTSPSVASTTPTSTVPTTTTPVVSVLSYKLALMGSALSVAKSGAVTIKVNCAGQSSCKGSVTLTTASAVSMGKHKKKAVLTLAKGAFNAPGGHVQALTLHLSAAGRALLARAGSRGLRARVTIIGRDSAGATHTTVLLVTLHAVKAKKHH
ncbi:MAG TPA: PKD domain-containing protein [Solirubrobacteraceae bacterium]|jgi:PKD repeat protein